MPDGLFHNLFFSNKRTNFQTLIGYNAIRQQYKTINSETLKFSEFPRHFGIMLHLTYFFVFMAAEAGTFLT